MADRAIKPEPGVRDNGHYDAQMSDAKPTYKSWKKKYRKMRIQFDNSMHESEELHKLEQKAMRTAKRLAVENDRLMDLLMDINESPQIPFERRINLSLEDNEQDEEVDASQKPTRSLKQLLEDVPHTTYATSVERHPEVLDHIQPEDAEACPISFLTAEEVDTYLAELDTRIGLKAKPAVPTSVQASTTPNTSAANFALRNPTSVYNWLRKHAPKTFLQDLEKDKDKDKDKDKEKDHDNGHGEKTEGGAKRKSTAGGRGGAKKQSLVGRKDVAESMEFDEEVSYDAQNAGSIRGKRKRDDDRGYRPKGGASRPTKKRKSRDLGSSLYKSRKSNAAS